jgi:hypothetical protein
MVKKGKSSFCYFLRYGFFDLQHLLFNTNPEIADGLIVYPNY